MKGLRQTRDFLLHSFSTRSFAIWVAGATLGIQCLPLSAETVPIQDEQFSITGWATVGPGTRGGEGGERVIVSTPEDLVYQIRRQAPLVIEVEGTIDLTKPFPGYKPDGQYHVASHKTIFGLGANAGLWGGELRLTGVTNVIIRNLTFRKAPDTALAITHGTTHVWIDHNDFAEARDGLIDITRASDYITISWNRFSDHTKVSLVGAGDTHFQDRGRNRVTFHHNWFKGTNERHPRVRFGRVHLFNNLYDQVQVGIGIGVEAAIISEANVFQQLRVPYFFQDNEEQPGFIHDSNSLFDQTPRPDLPSTASSSWLPSRYYSYTLDDPHRVADRVRRLAGVGIIHSNNDYSR
jgi:pectate lyase